MSVEGALSALAYKAVADMEKDWIDYQIGLLEEKLKFFSNRTYRTQVFGCLDEIYPRLEGGDEIELQKAVEALCRHCVIYPPRSKYEWGIIMPTEAAGQYNSLKHEIRIPFQFAGRKFEIGSILAHELSHILLFSRGIILPDNHQNEMLTDISAIYFGLGKLFLNGIISFSDRSNAYCQLGYVPLDLLVFAYKRILSSYGADQEQIESGLTDVIRFHVRGKI